MTLMNKEMQKIQDHFAEHVRTIKMVSQELAGDIERCAALIVDALNNGKKLLIMGNGGSAADAQHMAAEFVGRFLLNRKALPAIALTTDTSILTAVSNDYGYNETFKRQVEALAVPGDVVIGISTSGNSNNVLYALAAAREAGCKTVGLLGRDGGAIAGAVDVTLTVSAEKTPYIQEAHLTIIHILCNLVEQKLFGQT
jgi:D-sedoheptulose 7-phosphate isomerase